MTSHRIIALGSALLAAALAFAPAAGANAAAASWTYPDSSYPDFPYGSWDRESGGENIGRAGYLFQACNPTFTLGFNSTTVDVDHYGFTGTFSGTTFSLSLSVPDPSSGPYPGEAPVEWEYDTVDEYQAALAAWSVLEAAYHPYLYQYSSEQLTGAATGAHAEAAFTIPAAALTYGSDLEINAFISPVFSTTDPNYPGSASPWSLSGTVPLDDVSALTCDLNGSAPGIGTPPDIGSGSPAGPTDPVETALSSAQAPVAASGSTLAATGSGAGDGVTLGAGILLLGALALIVSRRRNRA